MTTLHRRMRARDIHESHRVSTPLELIFDLTFVVGVSALVTEFARAIVEGRAPAAIGPFFMTFFAIWWAWNQFTWLASGYDADDVVYRILTLAQMGGVLVIAAGVPAAFQRDDWVPVTIGYAIMRVALILLLARAWREDPESAGVIGRYVVGVGVVQALWLGRLLLPHAWTQPTFPVLAVLEILVPLWADRAGGVRWHPHHIAERLGLFTIILLGECVYVVSNAVRDALRTVDLGAPLVVVAVCGLVLLFVLWWLYFSEPTAEGLERRRDRAFYWAYGHYFVYASLAAVGAGLDVLVVMVSQGGEVPPPVAAGSLAWPVAAYLVLLWAVHAPLVRRTTVHPLATWLAALLIAAAPLAADAVGVLWVTVAVTVLAAALLAVMLASEAARAGGSTSTAG